MSIVQCRAVHFGFEVLQCSSKSYFKATLTIRKIYLLALPFNITCSKSTSLRNCEKWYFSLYKKLKITASGQLWAQWLGLRCPCVLWNILFTFRKCMCCAILSTFRKCRANSFEAGKLARLSCAVVQRWPKHDLAMTHFPQRLFKFTKVGSEKRSQTWKEFYVSHKTMKLSKIYNIKKSSTMKIKKRRTLFADSSAARQTFIFTNWQSWALPVLFHFFNNKKLFIFWHFL